MTTLNQNGPDFFRAQYLTIFIKNLLNQNSIFLAPLFKPSIAAFIAEDMVIECSTRDLQCFTKRMDIILAIELLQFKQPLF